MDHVGVDSRFLSAVYVRLFESLHLLYSFCFSLFLVPPRPPFFLSPRSVGVSGDSACEILVPFLPFLLYLTQLLPSSFSRLLDPIKMPVITFLFLFVPFQVIVHAAPLCRPLTFVPPWIPACLPVSYFSLLSPRSQLLPVSPHNGSPSAPIRPPPLALAPLLAADAFSPPPPPPTHLYGHLYHAPVCPALPTLRVLMTCLLHPSPSSALALASDRSRSILLAAALGPPTLSAPLMLLSDPLAILFSSLI
ncbi:hypothetical protein BCR44DRAFT_1157079 [Catenaria anguillulae PL171]|uniref:Uncharacterized protein n=1 Tax=Catenaria anguillulae PL171 TaxID=765915 RepID=A0A1Y2HKV3_9FUNG|nr:hypothetical protein BCR44DRAFT_1157079 [Catenaria anguillulae PL171]